MPDKEKRSHRISRGCMICLIILAALILCLIAAMHSYNSQKNREFLEMQQISRESYQKYMEQVPLESAPLSVSQALQSYLPGIVCWGDSLTVGAGGNHVNYPEVLEELIRTELLARSDEILLEDGTHPEIPVKNMGISGENTNEILARNGAVPYLIAEQFVIPEDCTPVEITLKSAGGREAQPHGTGKAGMESVTIGGVEGTLSIDWDESNWTVNRYDFIRSQEGREKTISPGTKMITYGSEHYRNYIPIVFMGTNGGYESVQDLIDQQKAIILHQSGNPKDRGKPRFLIIGKTFYEDSEDAEEMESALEKAYGDQFINLREYMSTQAMEDAGLTPTKEDLQQMKMGMVPSSLRSDNIHFNSVGYELLGKLVYSRMEELHYFDEVREAIGRELRFR